MNVTVSDFDARNTSEALQKLNNIEIGISTSNTELNTINNNILSSDISYYKLQAGDVSAMSEARPYTNYGQLFGLNIIDGEQPIWNGGAPKIQMTFGQQLQITSSSGNDTFGGTGANYLRIEGLDANWNDVVDTVAMGGLSTVNSNLFFFRVNRIVALCGSSRTNAGTISVTDSLTNLQAVMNSGEGVNHSTYRSFKYPAVIKDLLINNTKTGGGSQPVVRYRLYVNMFSDIIAPFSSHALIWDVKLDTSVDNWVQLNDVVSDNTFGKTDAWITASTSQNDTDTAVKIGFIEFKNLNPVRPSLN